MNRYKIIEIEDNIYVFDTQTVLTSNPPKYHLVPLTNSEHRYEFCSFVNGEKTRTATIDEIKKAGLK